MLAQIKRELQKASDPKRKEVSERYFKTGKGEYGEGDIFLGLTMPQQRVIAKQFKTLGKRDLSSLLKSKMHEHRSVGLLILVHQFEKADKNEQKRIVDFYLKSRKGINNWDLVDGSAPYILGTYLVEHQTERKILYQFARSKDLWEKRIAIIATYAFIKNNDFEDTLTIAKILLHDKHDLIHKAVGWMLREVGNRNQKKEEEFLKKYYKSMPRTMLRYAIEKFDQKKRTYYMSK